MYTLPSLGRALLCNRIRRILVKPIVSGGIQSFEIKDFSVEEADNLGIQIDGPISQYIAELFSTSQSSGKFGHDPLCVGFNFGIIETTLVVVRLTDDNFQFPTVASAVQTLLPQVGDQIRFSDAQGFAADSNNDLIPVPADRPAQCIAFVATSITPAGAPPVSIDIGVQIESAGAVAVRSNYIIMSGVRDPGN